MATDVEASNPRNESLLAEAGHIPDSVSATERRSIAIKFLQSKSTIASLVFLCRGETSEAREARLTLACVLLMAKQDAPDNLVRTDVELYAVLKQRIADLRAGGWVR